MSLFDISELSPSDIDALVVRAGKMANQVDEKLDAVVATLFFEPSTRTRLSFELAARKLGCEVVTFDPETSSGSKGEDLKDTVLTVAALGVDLLIVRHGSVGVPEAVARWTGLEVLNAGDGRRSHPSQTLLDLVTIRERFGRIEGLDVAIVGDITNSRVARGLIDSLPRLGANVTLVGPSTLVPRDVWKQPVSHDLDMVLPNVDVAYLLRVQKERGARAGYPSDDEYHRRFGLTGHRAASMREGAVVMHPGPINRGVEIAAEVADGPRSLILDQVRNGVPTRMALIERSLAAPR